MHSERCRLQIGEYLRTWIPTREFSAPSREGIARDLQQLAKNRATDWSKDAQTFIGLHPTYVRGIILGLNDACTARVPRDLLSHAPTT